MTLEDELKYVATWACCHEPERRVRAEHTVKYLLSLIVREWPGGGWVATLPEAGRTFHNGNEIEPGKYWFKDRHDAIFAVCEQYADYERSKPMADKANEDAAFLNHLILTCPETHEPQAIVSVRGKEAGLDHAEIITKGKTTSWRHKIFTEEV